jgi:hypothetical protein
MLRDFLADDISAAHAEQLEAAITVAEDRAAPATVVEVMYRRLRLASLDSDGSDKSGTFLHLDHAFHPQFTRLSLPTPPSRIFLLLLVLLLILPHHILLYLLFLFPLST